MSSRPVVIAVAASNRLPRVLRRLSVTGVHRVLAQLEPGHNDVELYARLYCGEDAIVNQQHLGVNKNARELLLRARRMIKPDGIMLWLPDDYDKLPPLWLVEHVEDGIVAEHDGCWTCDYMTLRGVLAHWCTKRPGDYWWCVKRRARVVSWPEQSQGTSPLVLST